MKVYKFAIMYFKLKTVKTEKKQQIYMEEGKKKDDDVRNTQLFIRLRPDSNPAANNQVGMYDTEITAHLKHYPTVKKQILVRFFVNYPCG